MPKMTKGNFVFNVINPDSKLISPNLKMKRKGSWVGAVHHITKNLIRRFKYYETDTKGFNITMN